MLVNIFIIADHLTPTKTIQHVLYKEGKTPSKQRIIQATYKDVFNVYPGVDYSVKVEVLRNDLGSSSEKVSRIALNGHTIGDCNPDGDDFDCTFFDCSQTISSKSISSSTGSIDVSFTYQGHSWDCDCSKETWQCAKENTVTGFNPMVAVARITLSPLKGN